MRRANYLFGTLALGLGLIIGTVGVLLLSSSSSPTSFISKLRGQDKVQSTSSLATSAANTQVGNNVSSNGVLSDANSGLTGQQNGNSALGQNDSSQNQNSQNAGSQNNSNLNGSSQNETDKNLAALSPLQQQIIADYKQDIGIFFSAWKTNDMSAFRQKLAQAYTGDLFEKHARRAEGYLVQGLGLDVSQITFDQVTIESADATTATLRADYRYTARDYNLADAAPVGEEHEHNVHVRVNMIKQNSRWLITGETTAQ